MSVPKTWSIASAANAARVEFWALPGVSVGGAAARIVAQRRRRDAHLSGALQPARRPQSARLGMSVTVVADGERRAGRPRAGGRDFRRRPGAERFGSSTAPPER